MHVISKVDRIALKFESQQNYLLKLYYNIKYQKSSFTHFSAFDQPNQKTTSFVKTFVPALHSELPNKKKVVNSKFPFHYCQQNML